jgi:hypothetical protein
MLKKIFLVVGFLCISGLYAQKNNGLYRAKKIKATLESVAIDSSSINPSYFVLLDANRTPIDSVYYQINFQKGTFQFRDTYPFLNDSVTVSFLKYPNFLTKEYALFDKSQVINNGTNWGEMYRQKTTLQKKIIPFDGLDTSGSITRGVTIGNNQNSVVNSTLDLQVIGKISNNVSLRASIQDSNVPLQEGGYSQKLDEFDQLFIELFSDRWAIRAGDLFLENRQSKFLNFNKKVQGLSSRFEWGAPDKKTTIHAAAALVRGQYAKSVFTGQEGNQGPYKLIGPSGEAYILVISGSERVYVNGILLNRGENNDYSIDYNAGEVKFTTLFPITSEMRITIEYQYTDRNYTRITTYAGATHEQTSWKIGGYLYTESDIKNQPLQQNLSEEQAQILVAAGDNPNLMSAPSAYSESYSNNKILYKKSVVDGTTIYEFSNTPTDELFYVRFTLVGANQGNYVLSNSSTIGRIYTYVPPVNGIPQGLYEPIIRLIAPSKIQIASVLGAFTPSEKTTIDFELGLSNSDKNLFSSLDDTDNKGIAGKINLKQRLLSKKGLLDVFANYQIVQKQFKTIERLFNIEFDRDWNLNLPLGNQSLLVTGLNFKLPTKGNATYLFEKLDFTENFSGQRHVFNSSFELKQWSFRSRGSLLTSNGTLNTSKFIRNETQVKYHHKKNWAGTSFRLENNQEKVKSTGYLSALSQRFSEWGAFVGRGDSTQVFVELGYLNRSNDSLKSTTGVPFLSRVNSSNSYYIKSKVLQNKKSDLSVFVNYRKLNFVDQSQEDAPSLNSRLVYNSRFFDQLIQVSTTYETTSGALAQQEFTYLEVEPGQGVYTWNDYNGNQIQELEEFEIAPFVDQAKYVRLFLPNQIFIKTHQNKFSQSLTLNPSQWQNKTGLRKFVSRFYNQTSLSSERKIGRDDGNFDFNPFENSDSNVLGMNTNFRNSLYYNRGKQIHSITYTYLSSRLKNLLSIGSQESATSSHQINYLHLYQSSWLLFFGAKTINTEIASENYGSKNYSIEGFQFGPKVSYLFTKNTSWDLFYEYQKKEDLLGQTEKLKQHRLGMSFRYAGKKQLTMNGEFSLFDNQFSGNQLAPAAYQLLEGLLPGKNTTWRLLLQKNITQYLDINLNYQGRKGETSAAIHTGSVQLRAFF